MWEAGTALLGRFERVASFTQGGYCGEPRGARAGAGEFPGGVGTHICHDWRSMRRRRLPGMDGSGKGWRADQGQNGLKLDQITHPNLKRQRYVEKIHDTDITDAALNPGNIRPMQISLFGELFLRESERQPALADFFAKRFARIGDGGTPSTATQPASRPAMVRVPDVMLSVVSCNPVHQPGEKRSCC
jgi:hypothetical protein